MPKEVISATIEPWLAQAFRSQVPQRERSKIIQTLIENFVRVQKPTEDEAQIKAEIENLREKMFMIQDQLAKRSSELAILESDTQRKRELIMKMADFASRYNPARDIEL